MDRVNELRCGGGGAGGSGSRDSTLDTTSPPSEAYMSANDTSSKYFSLSDSTFDVNPIKDVSLSSTAEAERPAEADLISNLSPIGKDMMDSYKIGKQIEAANILSGGVDIFEDNDDSFDGDELVIDDNMPEKCNEKGEEACGEAGASGRDTEVVLQIDGNNVNAIDIGNGLYLYRKDGQEELAAVQILDDGQQQPSFKFLKVRENSEGNLEVYEEIEIEIPKEVPTNEESGSLENSASHVPIKDINKVITDTSNTKVTELNKSPQKAPTTSTSDGESELKETQDTKTEVNLNGKMMKFSESRKSPVVGSFTPMTYHSTPNKEGKPLTKTMVDLQLNPSRHSDNVKKTIEVHTDSNKQRPIESQTKRPTTDSTKLQEIMETTEKSNDNVDATEKDIKTVDNVEVSEQKESSNDTKSKEMVDSNIELNEEKVIKHDDIIDELVIDEDLESNEIGNLVIDEKLDEPIKSVEINQDKSDTQMIPLESDQKKLDEAIKPTEKDPKVLDESIKPILNIQEKLDETIKPTETVVKKLIEPTSGKNDEADKKKSDGHVIKINDPLPLPTTEVTENKIEEHIIKNEVHISEENINIDKDKLNEYNISGTKDNIQSVDKADGKTTLLEKNVDAKEIGKLHNTETVKKLIPSIDTLKELPDNDKEVDTKEVEPVKERESKPSVTNVMLSEEDKKHIVKDATDVKAKKEVREISLPNTAPGTKSSETNIERSKFNVANIIPNVPLKINEQTNKKEIILSSQNSTIAKPTAYKPDEKLVPKTEVKPTNKQVTTIKESIVDKKPSSSELSKAIESKDDNQVTVDKPSSEVKPININHNAVPFGKWTEVNRQEFLNKFKEHKMPVNANSKQIKNSNDLNRRDVLKKIDSQRQSNMATSKEKPNVKNETLFTNKLPSSKPDTKIPVKKDVIEVKPKLSEPIKSVTKQEMLQKPVGSSTVSSSSTVVTNTKKNTKKEPTQQKDTSVPATSVAKTESMPRREVNVNDLINRTIEDMLNKVVPMRTMTDETKQIVKKTQVISNKESSVKDVKINKNESVIEQNNILDDIEIKMNELHGIPFVERPPHELPKVPQSEIKVIDKLDADKSPTKALNKNDVDSILIPDNAIDVDSEEEVIEHEPITGDIETKAILKLPPQEVTLRTNKIKSPISNDAAKREAVITEKDFDKFARRNSITYDCKTVNLETKETHNVVQNVRNPAKTLSKNPSKECLPLEGKSKLPLRLNTYSRKPNMPVVDEPNSKNYQSKIHTAYQSALTSKIDRRPVERPITIIEDKPVKVVFMENTADFVPGPLNVQGQELSPVKNLNSDPPKIAATDSLSSSASEQEDKKQIDDYKSKTKHQRKQVLTPVETPELELIQPSDIGIDVSPKKKRKTDDNKNEKHYKNLVHKKSYLLGRSSTSEDKINNISPKEENKFEEVTTVNMNTTSALDNLVKAAELIENQSEKTISNVSPASNSPQGTTVKRGRGRPRKTPLQENDDVKVPTSQKKPRLIDAKPVEDDSESDDDSLEEGIVKENWTMGKINENIVCPICNKLFRSENVVFKHVKHCTGVSPNRSDSDKRSPRRDRHSQESDLKSLDSRSDMDFDNEEKTVEIYKKTPKKRKSKEINAKNEDDKTEVIVIEDTPVKKKSDSNDDLQKEKKVTKTKIPPKTNNLVCEFCGKTFRQLSYLVSHKLQHKKEETIKKTGKDNAVDTSTKGQVFSCEVCKKEFRKLHHLVQHRIIHNTNADNPRNLRKASSEQIENKTVGKDETVSKQNDDPSAAFRCEPCDKSFRKLHHLVEHRETHDGINRQKVSTSTTTSSSEQTPAPPQCDVCKKTFRKLHHLVEHKEQHLETSSEKSDDKSVKSVLSTKDIIHECSLCYMVFPNEQSLNKHFGNCQRKKRQSKTAKNETSNENTTNQSDGILDKEGKKVDDDMPKIIAEEIIDDDDDVSVKSEENKEKQNEVKSMKISDDINKLTNEDKSKSEIKDKSPQREITEKVDRDETKISTFKKPEASKAKEQVQKEKDTTIDNTKKEEDKDVKSQTHKKRTSIKEKVEPTVAKRRRTVETTTVTVKEPKPDSSDDDEVRYMFNPNFKVDETNEGKVFMKVRANKRNSLQIERPNSKDLVKRRTSLQHPPKIPKLKTKSVEPKIVSSSHTTLKPLPKLPKVEATTSDSDDSDVKYSFPKNVPEKSVKPVNEPAKKPGRKSVVDKRKTLTGVAKRKSLGQTSAAKNKAKPSPVKTVKKRTECAEHRCDCGQLFSSAALLSRHTSLAHTPPRIRRRRSPPPDPRPPAKSTAPTDTRKSTKPDKTEPKSVTPKARRSTTNVTAHKGVPVPDKMRKVMQKNNKK